MTPESENFEPLRRLLALKRHEVPPPGYFHNFSRDVIARIKAGEQGDAALAFQPSWLQRLWIMLERKPAVVGAFGVAVCCLLVGGILQSEGSAPMPGPVTAETDIPFPSQVATPVNPSLAAISMPMMVSSTNPVPSGGSLFDQVPLPSSQRAGYRFILQNQ